MFSFHFLFKMIHVSHLPLKNVWVSYLSSGQRNNGVIQQGVDIKTTPHRTFPRSPRRDAQILKSRMPQLFKTKVANVLVAETLNTTLVFEQLSYSQLLCLCVPSGAPHIPEVKKLFIGNFD